MALNRAGLHIRPIDIGLTGLHIRPIYMPHIGPIDGLLHRLTRSGNGCFVGHEYVGRISYTDDLIIVAPSVSALKSMINSMQYRISISISNLMTRKVN